MYRPQSENIKLFLDKMEEMLINLGDDNSIIIVAGDFNIDLTRENKNVNEFCSSMKSFNFSKTI